MKKILIVEDAGPDRRRFRQLFDDVLQRRIEREDSKYKDEVEYKFAWDAKEKCVTWQMDIADKTKVRAEVEKYDYLFLDLAWTKYEEDVMNNAKRQSEKWLRDNADHWTEQAKLDMNPEALQRDGLVKNISGFALLDILNEGQKSETRVTVTTGFYSLAVVKFCADRWGVVAFHKWEDENMIESFVIEALRDKGKEK